MRQPFTKSVVASIATLLLVMPLAGCGQKGPLTLPGAQPAASAAVR